jgi:hypothetical protein
MICKANQASIPRSRATERGEKRRAKKGLK